MTPQIDVEPGDLQTLLALLRRHLPDTEAWVYGSRATGNARPNSDLDLVVFATPEQRHDVGNLREAFDESNLPFRVDLFVWDDVPDAFHDRIRSERITLTVPFGDVACRIHDAVDPGQFQDIPYVGLEHISKDTLQLAGMGKAKDVSSVKTRFRRGDVLFGKLRPYFRKVVRAPTDGICSTDIWVLRPQEGVDARFLFYLTASREIVNAAVASSEGTRMPRAKWDFVARHFISLPPLAEQRRIAHILGTLDDKIELNRRMSATLDAMAQALFKSWFVDFDPVRAKMEGRDTGLPPEISDLFPNHLVDSEIGKIPNGWQLQALDKIAHFENGLALQKFRPAAGAPRLPVVKIAQLRSGMPDAGEWAAADIRPGCVIEDGDVVFSWSGSLLLRLWCGGRAALNQHLFKVTSQRFPKWFYLHCVDQHLITFQRIAAGKATTMGHIKRHHLADAQCPVPPEAIITGASAVLGPLVDMRIRSEIEGRQLGALRDALLPMLVSGDLRTYAAAR